MVFFRQIGRSFASLVVVMALAPGGIAAAEPVDPRPNVLILTVDTLRADRMSGYGYGRPTSPNLDRLMQTGARFTQARTVEPLTAPSMCAMLTSRFPHENGSTRNGLRMRESLPSLPKLLRDEGYRSAAFISNWTLRDKITGLGEHFDEYNELFRRKRWFGLISPETTADRMSDAALAWLDDQADDPAGRPFVLWVHYTDPHAPYEKHKPHLQELGLPEKGKLPPSDRYDTEIAYTDVQIERLLERFREQPLADNTLIVFASDHGESLGEHGYWGHGRNLYDPTLLIPMALVWPGRIKPGTIDALASNIDVAPTVAGLLSLEAPAGSRGFDWTPVLDGGKAPDNRATQHQAHRGAVLSRHDSDVARRAGLLEVGVVFNGMKEILRIKKGRSHMRFNLVADPDEVKNLAIPDSIPTEDLRAWMQFVDNGLRSADEVTPDPLDDETIERLRALGYAD
jgi:arylsulfatase A-like enzyme